MKLIHLENNKKKNLENDLNKIQARFDKWKWKMHRLKIKLQKY